MSAELNMDGKVIFDDQISEMIDTLLSVRGVSMIYFTNGKASWMKAAGDSGLRSGLRKLTDRQREIAESIVFEHRSQYEVMVRYHMTNEEMFEEMTALRNLLADAV